MTVCFACMSAILQVASAGSQVTTYMFSPNKQTSFLHGPLNGVYLPVWSSPLFFFNTTLTLFSCQHRKPVHCYISELCGPAVHASPRITTAMTYGFGPGMQSSSAGGSSPITHRAGRMVFSGKPRMTILEKERAGVKGTLKNSSFPEATL